MATENQSTESRPIVVGIDGGAAGRQALRWAIEEALIRRCEVQVIHAWEYEPTRDFMYVNSAELNAESKRVLEHDVDAATADLTDKPQITAKSVNGSAAKTLAELSGSAALLVVGKHRGGILREAVMGSVSAASLRHSECPVVIIPPGAVDQPDEKS